MKKVLFFHSYAPLRWYIFHDSKNETIAVDTLTFISEVEEVTNHQIYTAKVWIKYIVKNDDHENPFQMSLENVEIRFKFLNYDMGFSGEYRILEFYGYGWDDKNNYHTKYQSPSWETVIPDSAKEMNLVKIIQYDLERREKTNTQ